MMSEGVHQPDRRLGQPTITVGAGRDRPQGKATAISGTGDIAAWRDQLLAIPPAECAWWSPHIWKSDYSRETDWIGAHALGVDIDYHDPRLGRRKSHTGVSTEYWADLYNLAMDGGLPCNLLHATPRGARAVVVFDRVTIQADEMKAAFRAAAASIFAAITTAQLQRIAPEIGHGGFVRPGFVVDRAPFSLKGLFWAPRCTVNGEPRIADVHIVSGNPFDLTELVLEAPPPDPEPKPASEGSADAHYSEAAKRWCDDHPIDFAMFRRECPACGHRGCFGPLPETPDRWFCFSANHHWDSGGCGVPSQTHPEAYWGDALDLEAHRRRVTPREVLQQDGYLQGAGLLDGIDIGGLMRSGLAAPAVTPQAAVTDPGGEEPTSSPADQPAPAPKDPYDYRIQDLEAALRLQPPPPIVDGLLRERDLGVLFGAPGCGKSFVAIGLALALASGTPWLGMPVSGPAPVLYIAGEGAYGIGKRVLAWSGGQVPSTSPVWEHWRHLTALVPMLDAVAFPKLLGAIGQMDAPPRLILVDTLAIAMTGGDENSAKDMGLFVLRCGQLRDATGAAVLLIHHTGKAGGAERGSSALRGACDVMLSLERDELGAITLTTTKTKDERPPAPIGIELQEVGLGTDAHGRPVSSLRAVLASRSGRAEVYGEAPMLVLRALQDCPSGVWMSTNELMEATRIRTRVSLRKTLKKLQDEGLVIVEQKGNVKRVKLRPDRAGDLA